MQYKNLRVEVRVEFIYQEVWTIKIKAKVYCMLSWILALIIYPYLAAYGLVTGDNKILAQEL